MITGKVSHIRGGTHCSLNGGKGEAVSAGVGGVSECCLMGEPKHDGIREQYHYTKIQECKEYFTCVCAYLVL